MTKPIRNLRWWVAGLLALATSLNYLDRQSLPVLASEIRKTIPISDADFSWLQSAFLVAYGVMYLGGGRIMDRLGTRIGYAVMIVVWSLATMTHALASSVFGLGAARFLLGLGEGGSFPGSAKAVAEWFPARERSMAFGIFNTGSSIGAVVAPPLISLISSHADWRWVFWIAGSAGVAWGLLWLRFYRVPLEHPAITKEELELVREQAAMVRTEAVSWREVLRLRQTWGLLTAKFLSDSAWYFYIFWLPKYLSDIRHLNIKEIGFYAWVPYAFAGVGSSAGGWLGGYLIQRGHSIDLSRKVCLGISASLMPVALFIGSAPLSLAIVFFSLAMLGHQFWSTVIQTLAADLFPPRAVGTVAGLMGSAGSLGGVLFNGLIAWLLSENLGYGAVFTISGVLHPVSLAILLLTIRRVQRIPAI